MGTDNTENTENTGQDSSTNTGNEENRWVQRFEDLLKVKSFDELKSELGKLAGEVQSEIQGIDINQYLSPTAKGRLKDLEKRYSSILKIITKTQKQFDRDFDRKIRAIRQTQKDAQKYITEINKKISKQKTQIFSATKKVTEKFTTKAKSVSRIRRAGKRTGTKAKS